MSWQALDLDGNGGIDAWGWDGDHDGRFEQIWVDADANASYEVRLYDDGDDGRMDRVLADVDRDGTYDVWGFDVDRDGRLGDYLMWDRDHDGRFEAHSWDGDEDGRAEYVMLDTDRDGFADRWIPVDRVASAPTSTSTAVERTMTQHVVTMNQLRVYGTRIFG